MSDEPTSEPSQDHREVADKAKNLEAAGWGMLLVWLGITTLFSLGWPVFLIGLGVLVLVLQGFRIIWNLGTETFWLVLGAVFVSAGIVESFGTRFPLVPIALIVFGAAALYGVYKRMNEQNR